MHAIPGAVGHSPSKIVAYHRLHKSTVSGSELLAHLSRLSKRLFSIPFSPFHAKGFRRARSGTKAGALIRDLLLLAGPGATVHNTVNLNHVIERALVSDDVSELKKPHPGIRLDVVLERDLADIRGSRAGLSRTVMNLLSNAFESMPWGGFVTLSTSIARLETPGKGYESIPGGEYVVVSVRDAGIGISQEHIPRLFEPFYTKKQMGFEGTGLEMAVVHRTVKDHHGDIDVRSSGGMDTVYELYFPATR